MVYYTGYNRENTLIMYGNDAKTVIPGHDPRDAGITLRIEMRASYAYHLNLDGVWAVVSAEPSRKTPYMAQLFTFHLLIS